MGHHSSHMHGWLLVQYMSCDIHVQKFVCMKTHTCALASFPGSPSSHACIINFDLWPRVEFYGYKGQYINVRLRGGEPGDEATCALHSIGTVGLHYNTTCMCTIMYMCIYVCVHSLLQSLFASMFCYTPLCWVNWCYGLGLGILTHLYTTLCDTKLHTYSLWLGQHFWDSGVHVYRWNCFVSVQIASVENIWFIES